MIRLATLAAIGLFAAGSAGAADYKVDIDGAHAFVNFKFKHLGYSVLSGTFREFDGKFSWDAEDPAASSIQIDIDVTSIDSNHAERDKHIRGKRYLNTDKFPTAQFVSTGIKPGPDGHMTVLGDLTLHGETQPIEIDTKWIGEGDDPWGGYRAGFEGYVTIDTRDFGMKTFLPGHMVDMELFIEGVRAQ